MTGVPSRDRRPSSDVARQQQIGPASLSLHERHGGLIELALKTPLNDADDLALAYTPGVAAVCEAIAEQPDRAGALTVAGRSIAVVTDGSAVLGLGDIGPRAAMPVMEGKCALFKALVGLEAWPICLDAREPDRIVAAIESIAPGFAGINLEDIAAPRCFEIERRLQQLGVPVMHDDQHGTAIVVLAGLLNAARVAGRPLSSMRVVVAGAGAAGRAICRLLRCVGQHPGTCDTVAEVIACDSRGALHDGRDDLSPTKREMLSYTNPHNREGALVEVLAGADVFIGVSRGGLLSTADIRTMADNPIVFALANPTPEIMPDEAHAGGAAVVATGRSDLPNQVNNVLVFPGIFRGALDAGAAEITDAMKIAAAEAIARSVESPRPALILPDALTPRVHTLVTQAVKSAA